MDVTRRTATSPVAPSNSPGRWEHFEHRADVGVRGIGPTCAAAFEQAALALTAIVTPAQGVAARQRIKLACRAADLESLLVAWLNALLTQMAVRHMVFGKYRVEIQTSTDHEAALRASAWGEPVSVARHQPAVEVKGATYTALRVGPCDGGGWLAQTVVDV